MTSTPPPFVKRLAWLRECRTASLESVRDLIVRSLDPTDVLGMCNLLRRPDVHAWTDGPAVWVPRHVGRRATDDALGALLAHPDAERWPDVFVLVLVRGHQDLHATDGEFHFTRLLQTLTVAHPAAVARLAVAKARADAWSFLWHLPDFQAAGLDDAIRVGLPFLLQHADAEVRERALVGLGDGVAVAPAPASPRPAAGAPSAAFGAADRIAARHPAAGRHP